MNVLPPFEEGGQCFTCEGICEGCAWLIHLFDDDDDVADMD